MTLNGLWMGTLAGQSTFARSRDLIMGVEGSASTTEWVFAYPWNDSTGWGTKYATLTPQPPVASATGSRSHVTLESGKVAVAHTTTPFISAYDWNSGVGLGSKYSDPATLPPGNGKAATFNPGASQLVMAHTTSPFVSAYPWSSGFGAKYANPATVPLATTHGSAVGFNPAGNALLVGTDGNAPNNYHAYAWSSSGFGAKYANPATAVGGNNLFVSAFFSPSGNSAAGARGAVISTPIAPVYVWSNGFGTKYANFVWAGTGNGVTGARFNPAENLFLIMQTVQQFGLFPWNPGFGTKFAAPVGSGGSQNPPLTSWETGAAYTPDGSTVFLATNRTERVRAWPVSSTSGFGTAYADLVGAPAVAVSSIAVTPN